MDYREIPLTKGRVARVSPEDFEDVSRFNWRVMDTKDCGVLYAIRATTAAERRAGMPKSIMLHRHLLYAEVMEAPRGTVVAHRDGDGLNCQRHNLFLSTQAGNVQHDHSRNAMRRTVEAARAKAWNDEGEKRRRESRYEELARRGLIPG